MTTMQLNCFLSVAETLNFAATAKQLNVTQPAVTQQIHALEQELNVELFKRTTRTVRLTQEGYVFLGDARAILNIMMTAKRRFSDPNSLDRMPFSIGCHSYSELNLLPDILHKMSETYPVLAPHFHVIRSQLLFQLLKERRLDVVLSFQSQTNKKNDGVYQEFAKIRTVGILPKTSSLFSKNSLTVSDLEMDKVILYNPQNSPDAFNQNQRKIIGGKVTSDIFFCDSPEACITLAKAGFGITVLPDLFIQKSPDLAYIPFPEFGELSYGAYYNNTTGNPHLKLFLQLCKESFPFSK